jgi:glucose-6-phosphate 1-dehydrogenase
VQNIMTARFDNMMVERLWNSDCIDSVQITAAETVDVGTRGKFYDATGALRDMVPNHLFTLLAMVAMEPPNSFDAEAIRDEKGSAESDPSLGAGRGKGEWRARRLHCRHQRRQERARLR